MEEQVWQVFVGVVVVVGRSSVAVVVGGGSRRGPCRSSLQVFVGRSSWWRQWWRQRERAWLLTALAVAVVEAEGEGRL